MNPVLETISTISLAIVGVAIVAVLVSRNANTAGVLKAYGDTFGAMIGAATSPVSGTRTAVLGMPPIPGLYG